MTSGLLLNLMPLAFRGGYKQLGADGRAAEGRLRGDDQTENDTLSEVFHASPADINVAQ